MPMDNLLDELKKRKREALSMGGEEKLEKRRQKGFMNARERIEYLFDKGTFLESGLHAKAISPEVRHKSPADGKIAGYGRINGRGRIRGGQRGWERGPG